jgi:hypothetical protein
MCEIKRKNPEIDLERWNRELKDYITPPRAAASICTHSLHPFTQTPHTKRLANSSTYRCFL